MALNADARRRTAMGRQGGHGSGLRSMSRAIKSTANVSGIDFTDVLDFAERLELTSRLVDEMRDEWKKTWTLALVEELKTSAPRGRYRSKMSRAYGPLHSEITFRPPGGVSFGSAFYGRFLEYGTSKMAPRPFVRPAIKRIRSAARKDAVQRAADLLRAA